MHQLNVIIFYWEKKKNHPVSQFDYNDYSQLLDFLVLLTTAE